MKTGAESLFSFSIEEEKLPKKIQFCPLTCCACFEREWEAKGKGRKRTGLPRVAHREWRYKVNLKTKYAAGV